MFDLDDLDVLYVSANLDFLDVLAVLDDLDILNVLDVLDPLDLAKVLRRSVLLNYTIAMVEWFSIHNI
jgi:hypothetical protein